MKDKNRIVGECSRCGDPVYAFQLVKDNMHEGCSKLVWNKSKKEWE